MTRVDLVIATSYPAYIGISGEQVIISVVVMQVYVKFLFTVVSTVDGTYSECLLEFFELSIGQRLACWLFISS